MKRRDAWKVSEALWSQVEPLIPEPARDQARTYLRRPGGGRKPLDYRKVFEAILYVLRTGCQWKALPKKRFGSASSIHAHFQRWLRKGFFHALWRAGLAEHDEMAGIAWKWQAAGLSGEPTPTDPGRAIPGSRDARARGPRKKGSHTIGRAWNPAIARRNRGQSR